ncbi:DUF2523 family protein [Metapseudomonas otitidis]
MNFVDKILGWFKAAFETLLGWWLDFVLWLPKKVWGYVFDGLATVIEKLPVPDFVSQAGSFMSQLPSGVVFFFQYFAVAEGLAMITASLLLRFILRRIPFIG